MPSFLEMSRPDGMLPPFWRKTFLRMLRLVHPGHHVSFMLSRSRRNGSLVSRTQVLAWTAALVLEIFGAVDLSRHACSVLASLELDPFWLRRSIGCDGQHDDGDDLLELHIEVWIEDTSLVVVALEIGRL